MHAAPTFAATAEATDNILRRDGVRLRLWDVRAILLRQAVATTEPALAKAQAYLLSKGYSEYQTDAIVDYLRALKTAKGCPSIAPEHQEAVQAVLDFA